HPGGRGDPAQGDQGRLPSVRPQLLPALPALRAPGRGDRHLDRAHRLSLRRPGRSVLQVVTGSTLTRRLFGATIGPLRWSHTRGGGDRRNGGEARADGFAVTGRAVAGRVGHDDPARDMSYGPKKKGERTWRPMFSRRVFRPRGSAEHMLTS